MTTGIVERVFAAFAAPKELMAELPRKPLGVVTSVTSDFCSASDGGGGAVDFTASAEAVMRGTFEADVFNSGAGAGGAASSA